MAGFCRLNRRDRDWFKMVIRMLGNVDAKARKEHGADSWPEAFALS